MIKQSVHEDHTNLNMYAWNHIALKYIKHKLTDLQSANRMDDYIPVKYGWGTKK